MVGMNDYRSDKKPILVLGVGNSIQTDDGIGVHVIEQLSQLSWPDSVELIDGGTAGLDLLATIEGRRKVIVIDAVDGGMDPGTMFRFTPDDIGNTTVRLDSLHQFGLLETLQMSQLMDRAPESCVIFGVQPKTVDWGLSLTDTVAAVVPRLIEEVSNEINAAAADHHEAMS